MARQQRVPPEQFKERDQTKVVPPDAGSAIYHDKAGPARTKALTEGSANIAALTERILADHAAQQE